MLLASQLTTSLSRQSVALTCKRHASEIKVILLQELSNRGQVGSVINVKRGYARNFLVPKQIAGKCLFSLR